MYREQFIIVGSELHCIGFIEMWNSKLNIITPLHINRNQIA